MVTETLGRLRDKADRISLAFELGYNTPHLTPLRFQIEMLPQGDFTDEALRQLDDMRSHLERFTVRTYKPGQTVGSEPLFLDVSFEEALLLASISLRRFSITDLDSFPPDMRAVFEDVRLRADSTLRQDGYSFGREFYKLLSKNRDGTLLNVLFQEYIDRDHAERSGRVAFYTDDSGAYSFKAPESGLGPMVRDVDYSSTGVISGTFTRVNEIRDDLMRSNVARPLIELLEIFPWRRGVVVEFDYHRVGVGRRKERLLVYDFHEAEVALQDVVGSELRTDTNRLIVVSRTRGPVDPKEIAEQILVKLGGRHGIYLSGPITTGLEFYRLLRRIGIDDLTQIPSEVKEVLRTELDSLIGANIKRLSEFAAHLSAREQMPVVDPGEIAVSDWSQVHYMALWTRVIELAIHKIYFLDGWEYSNGAIAEYCLGTRLGLLLLDQVGGLLTRERAVDLLRAADRNLRSMGYEVPTMRQGLSELVPT